MISLNSHLIMWSTITKVAELTTFDPASHMACRCSHIVTSMHAVPVPGGVGIEVLQAPPAETAAEVCLGGMVWQAAVPLCAWLTDRESLIRGRTVLELGAGTGVCGLHAAGLGAARVVLTEGGADEAALLALMRTNVEHNRSRLMRAVVEVQALPWGDEAALPAGPFEWVIGSDITWSCDDDAHRLLCRTLHAILERDRPRVVLAMQHGLPLGEPGGSHCLDETLQQFQAAAAAVGLRVVPPRDGQPVDVEPPRRGCGHAFEWPWRAFDDAEVFVVEVELAPPGSGCT